ncbi:MAG: cupin domain-containing protein [Spirochaetales bacterium]|nr:cupin domain-containing protein [Spirochaetales bacterium]
MVYNKQLGEKIKLLREKHEMTIDALSEQAGIAPAMVAKMEEGELVPYLSPLIKLSRALGVRLGTFLDDQENLGPVVTRKTDLSKVERLRGIDTDTHRDRAFYSLALNKTSRHMEPLIVELSPSDASGRKTSSHEGEEFIYVLEGEVEIVYGKEIYTLSSGESIYYDSIVQHDVKTAGSEPAKILAVLHEPA